MKQKSCERENHFGCPSLLRNQSVSLGNCGVRSDHPTLRKEREGWGTRRFVEGTGPKSSALPPPSSVVGESLAQTRNLLC
jgi:hypothetical protein